MQFPPAAPPRRPRRRVAERPPTAFVDVSGMRSRGRPVPASRVRAATTRARRSAQRSSAWCLGGRCALPTVWRRVCGSCATSQHWHRHTTQRRAGKPISTPSCALGRRYQGPRVGLLTYPGLSGTRARHAGSKRDHAGAFGERRRAGPLLHRRGCGRFVARRSRPSPRPRRALVPRPLRVGKPARATNPVPTCGVERATMRPILAAPRIVWGAPRRAGEPGGHACGVLWRYITRSWCRPEPPTAWIEVLMPDARTEVDGPRHRQHHGRRARSSAPS